MYTVADILYGSLYRTETGQNLGAKNGEMNLRGQMLVPSLRMEPRDFYPNNGHVMHAAITYHDLLFNHSAIAAVSIASISSESARLLLWAPAFTFLAQNVGSY